MTLRIRAIDYQHGDTQLGGELAWDDAVSGPRPAVLVVHDANKSDEGFESERAVALAGMGYAGFVVDVYGKNIHGGGEDAYALMSPFQEDRPHLLQRLLAAVSAACAQPEVDPARLAAIGYCFGGQCVLDLARGNAPLRGVASFHGTLERPDPERWPAPPEGIAPKIIAFHGWDDPFVPSDPHVIAFAEEMTHRDADWQFVAYGGTKHSFTNPGINLPEIGAVYDAKAANRSWNTLDAFLKEIFRDEA
ncbi:MAG: dienelactone hydrolase family protein [Myxococcota bacterium]